MTKIKNFIKKYIVTVIKNIDWANISASTYVRYILMLLAALNSLLNMLGKNPINVDENQLYELVSNVLTIVILVVNTYKNNSITKQGIEADAVLRNLKDDARAEVLNPPVKEEESE